MGEGTAQGAGSSGAAGKTLAGFEIISEIGHGAMGAVFKARQVSVDRIVALKILPQRLAQNERYAERFLREARSAAKLNHPNVVQAIDAGHAQGYYYFAMEYVDGPDAEKLLVRHGRLPEKQALEIVRDIARALDYADTHAHLIHRDIKPANILLTSDGVAKLADLGLAREATETDSRLTRTGAAMGTPNYISPEQVRGERELDIRTDIYSLGATLYHLLVGSPPFTGGTGTEVMAKHLRDPLPDPRKANPEISVGAAAIIRRAMAKKREERYPNAGAMQRAVEQLLAQHAAAGRRRAETPRQSAAPKAETDVVVAPTAVTATRMGQRVQPVGNKAVYVAAAVAATLLLVLLAVLLYPWSPAVIPEADRTAPTVTEPKVLIRSNEEHKESGIGGYPGHGPESVVRAGEPQGARGPGEAAAKEAWDRIRQLGEKPGHRDLGQLMGLLGSFEQNHGRTSFATSVAADLRRLRDEIAVRQDPLRFDSRFALSLSIYRRGAQPARGEGWVVGGRLEPLGRTPTPGGTGILIPHGASCFLYADSLIEDPPAVPGLGKDAGCEEGFLESLSEEIRNCPTIRGISLRGRNIRNEDMHHLGRLRQLEEIDLSCSTLSDQGLAALTGLVELVRLGIVNTSISNVGLGHISRMAKLEGLDLSRTLISDAGLAYLRGMRQLRSLCLLSCPAVSDAGLAQLAGLVNLEELALGTNPTRVTDEGLTHLKGLPQLCYLVLSGPVFTKGAGNLGELTTLEQLVLSDTNLTDDDLAQLKTLTRLSVLRISYPHRITDAGLAHLKALTNLRTLSLDSAFNVTDEGLRHLSALTRLETLELWNLNNITDTGIAHLKALKGLKNLDLAYCGRVTNSAVQELRNALHLEHPRGRDHREKERQGEAQPPETAEVPTPPKAEERIQKVMNERVSLFFMNTPLDDVVRWLRSTKQVNLIIDQPAVRNRDDLDLALLRLDDAKFAEVLAHICQQFRLTSTIVDGVIYITTKERCETLAKDPFAAIPASQNPSESEQRARAILSEQKRISMDFVATPLDDVVTYFRTLEKVNIMVNRQSLKGRRDPCVTLRLDGVTFRQALAHVCRQLDMVYTVARGAILITTPELEGQ